MNREYVRATDAGDMIAASYIYLGKTGATVGGYVQDCPATRYKVAMRADGSGWEALYDQGGGDCGISSDNFDDILAIRRMDDSCDSDAAALREGASELRSFARRIRSLDTTSDALGDVADYLDEMADAADDEADRLDDCADADDDDDDELVHVAIKKKASGA